MEDVGTSASEKMEMVQSVVQQEFAGFMDKFSFGSDDTAIAGSDVDVKFQELARKLEGIDPEALRSLAAALESAKEPSAPKH